MQIKCEMVWELKQSATVLSCLMKKENGQYYILKLSLLDW